MFLIDLSRMPSDHKIDFTIGVETITRPISIPPYRRASIEVKKLKA